MEPSALTSVQSTMSVRTWRRQGIALALAAAATAVDETSDPAAVPSTIATVPAYLLGKPGELYERKDGAIIRASDAELATARRYATLPDADKGPVSKGQRISILAAQSTYRVGEPVRVLHVLEALDRSVDVFVMGPKAIRDEYVDDVLASPIAREGAAYDGAVPKGPLADFHYEISTYRFDTPGRHTIRWKGAGAAIQGDLGLISNALVVTVVAAETP
ncbi:MAG: hypothetical protein H0W83_11445 [Planctomycetes bacterium]|nr:hypothetical protein [Planctomycetota bacterium]